MNIVKTFSKCQEININYLKKIILYTGGQEIKEVNLWISFQTIKP